MTPKVAARAGDLAEAHDLRGYDAVHLASLLEIASDDAVLATADTELKAAAQALGLVVAELPV